jgi:hypothetical protein
MRTSEANSTKWALLLFGIVVVSGAFVITFTVPHSAPSRKSVLSTAMVTGQVVWLPPALPSILRPPSGVSPRENIERAERLNLYQMQQYQRRVLDDIQSQSPSLPITTMSPALHDLYR